MQFSPGHQSRPLPDARRKRNLGRTDLQRFLVSLLRLLAQREQQPGPGDFQITYRDTNRVSGRDLKLWMTDDGTAKVYAGITPNPERNNNTPPNWYKYWRP